MNKISKTKTEKVVKKSTQEQLEDFYYRGNAAVRTSHQNAEVSCGITEFGNLQDNVSPRHQLKSVMEACMFDEADTDYNDDGEEVRLNGLNFGKGQTFFSDTVNSIRFSEAKKYAAKGLVSVNPNSGNKIQMYIFTPERIVKMARAIGVVK